MRVPAGDLTYHVISFERRDEAAAFIAALSRFLDSPRGSVYMGARASVEVWTRPTATGEPVEVYLDEGALEAATIAFGPVEVGGMRRGDALPPACALMIGGPRSPTWGLADVERRLTSS
jgi:hypothetical protein